MFDKIFKKSSKKNLNNDFLPAIDGGATNLTLYINKGEYQNGIVSKIEDVEHLISIGKNELSRRTNDLILKKSLTISICTLAIAFISMVVTIISIFK